MDASEEEVLAQVLAWAQAGQRAVLLTVLSTYGASPRSPGALAAISEDGQVVGSVSGGCVEDDLVAELRAGGVGFTPGAVTIREYGTSVEARERLRLPCGNTLRIAIETAWAPRQLAEVLARIRQGRCVRRRVDFASGAAQVVGAAPDEPPFREDEAGFATLLGPRWRLLLIGATDIAAYLTAIAKPLGFTVSVCDPREDYKATWRAEAAPLLPGMPDDVVTAFACDARSAVVALAHDPKLDDLALMEALRGPAFFVGALGSRATNAARRLRLRLFDLGAEQVARLHGPVGVPIGSRTPAEIAVSIAAQLVAARASLAQAAAAVPGTVAA